MSNSLATQATEMKSLNVASQINIAVIKQMQEQQQQQADALIAMIQDTPTPIADGVSQYVDFYA